MTAIKHFYVHLVLAIISAAATTVLLFVDLPIDEIGQRTLVLTASAVGWTVLRALVADVRAAYGAYVERRLDPLRDEAHAILSAALLRLIDYGPDGSAGTPAGQGAGGTPQDEGLDPADIGLSVFVAQRTLRTLCLRGELRRLSRLRLSAEPEPSRVRWTRGKGLIGRVWANGTLDVVKTGEAWRPRYTRRQWRKLPDETTLGLKYRDFKELADKYDGAIAVPMWGRSRATVGVVALDVRLGGNTPVERLVDRSVIHTLENAALEMRRYIRFAEKIRSGSSSMVARP